MNARSRTFAVAALLLFVLVVDVSSQCSDAGICAVGQGGSTSSAFEFTAGLEYGRSSADGLTFADALFGGQAVLTDGVILRGQFSVRHIDGPRGTTRGFGDLMLIVTFAVAEHEDVSVRADVGGRLATGSVNEKGLPQAYQPGLGTNDLLIGLSVSAGPFYGGGGYQIAGGRSENTVDRLARGDDLSIRAGYRILDDPAIVSVELLAIQKLSPVNARIPSAVLPPVIGGTENFADVAESDKLQLNVVASAEWAMSSGTRFALQSAFALLKRPVNLDGLKRDLSLSAAITIPIEE